MKKVISIITIMLILFVAITMSTNVYAANETTLELSSNSESINAGDSITLTLSVDNTNIENGLYTLQGKINYDKDIFENVTISGINNWAADYNTSNNLFVETGGTAESGAKSGGILTVTLKAKSGLTSNSSTTVTLSNMETAADSTTKVSVEDASYTFEVKASSSTPTPTPTATPTPTPTKTPTPTPTSTSGGTNGGSTSGKGGSDGTTSGGKLPAAGKAVISVGVIALAAIIGATGFLYRKYKDVK